MKDEKIWKNHQHNSKHILPSFPRNKFNHLYVYTRQMFPRFNVSRAWFRASSYSISKWPWKPSKHAMAAQHRVTTPIFFVVVRHEWMIQLQHCGMTPKNRLAACCSYNLKEIKTSATQKHTHTHTSGQIRQLQWLSLASAAHNWVTVDASC